MTRQEADVSGDAPGDVADDAAARLAALLDQRLGPYCSFNPVTRTQVWQWCSAMGEQSPLYLDCEYQAATEFAGMGAVAPPAMLQMWTMRDFNEQYAPGSTAEHPYPVMKELESLGFPANVAVSYDLQFKRYLVEGDRVQHYKTVLNISELKSTSLGEGHFFTDRMEYLDQAGDTVAEALITYFQYRPRAAAAGASHKREPVARSEAASLAGASSGADDVSVSLDDVSLAIGSPLPELRIPITHKLVVGGALATQDFIPVHHSVPAAQAAGMPDIFMNILTSCGLAARYLSDCAGPASRLQRLQLSLQAPNMPGDVMTLSGQVSDIQERDSTRHLTLDFSGSNGIGLHLAGSAVLEMAQAAS